MTRKMIFWVYIGVGAPVDTRADKGDKLMAPLVDDETANWRHIIINFYHASSMSVSQRLC